MKNLNLKISTFFMMAALVAAPAFAGISQADDKANPLALTSNDVVLGDADAPVTMIEYASMTCGHCAHFHTDTFPQIKKNYIETGKIRFVLRDMPWDTLATAVTKITRCVPDDEFYNYASAFLSTQQSWVRSNDPIAELKKVARLGGMDEAKFDSCLVDPAIHNEVLENRTVAIEQLKVSATPTFFIGDEIVVQGALPYEELAKKIDQALADAK